MILAKRKSKPETYAWSWKKEDWSLRMAFSQKKIPRRKHLDSQANVLHDTLEIFLSKIFMKSSFEMINPFEWINYRNSSYKCDIQYPN